MANAEERNTDDSMSMSSSDTTAESNENKKTEEKYNSRNSSKACQFGKASACAEWEPNDCLCNVTPCIPEIMAHQTQLDMPKNFTWKWPGRSSIRKKSPYSNFDPIMAARQNQSLPINKSSSGVPETRADFQEIHQKFHKNVTGKIEIYYFDHGNSAYYRTTDAIPLLTTERFADKTDQAATRFWAELFGTIHIGITFITAFILQLLRFILYSLIRPLTIGVIQLFSDYLMKPLLSIIFNALIQPVLILMYNIATSLRDLCEPIAEAIGFFIRQLARLLQVIRLVEVNKNIINGNVPT